MIHHLTPDFILANADKGQLHGQFPGIALFADISGFTPLTRALMAHGNEGAETIAAVLSSVFDPLVEIVFAHGGFIAGFAGDAIKAIFPLAGDDAANDARHLAVVAARKICAHMRAHHTHQTRFGPFDFDVTICAAGGDVNWEILSDQAEDGGLDGAPKNGQRMACMIEGSALARCLELDPLAETGEVVLSRELAMQLDPTVVRTEMVDSYARLVALTDVSENGQHGAIDDQHDNLGAQAHGDQAERFHSHNLLSLKTQGEFRRVITLFFDLQTLPELERRPAFEADFFRLLHQYDGYLCRVGRAGAWGSAATFLIFWGAPTGHENDNQRALDFALNLLDACPTPARAGITTNVAYAGFVGGARHEEYTCYGNYVNLAARQTKAAGWGEIWLDRETARQATGTFVTESLGVRQFKGFAEPRPVFQLHTRAAEVREHVYPQELIGREAELAELRRACQPIFDGRFGGTVTVAGEAGMGKSRLVHEFQQQLVAEAATTGRAVRWFLCQTDEILRQPLNPVRYFLRRYFEQTDEVDEAERKRRFEARLDELVALTRDEAQRAELQRVRSFLGALVDLHWPDSLYEQLDPQLRFENTIEALKSFIKAESLRQPLILQVEDIHWIDQESLALLARLMRNVADYPFVVVATARPSVTGTLDTRLVEAVPEEAPTTVVKLGALANDQFEALAADLLDGPPAPSLSTLLDARADGNPFFVEQILLYLREQELLIQTDDGWAIHTDSATDQAASQAVLSGDVRAVLTARLDRLASPVREVVQTAAVLGREFDERVLAHMLQQDQQLPEKLAAANKAAIWAAVEQARYMFRHALLRDAAYDMQLRAVLRSLHARASAAIEEVHQNNLPPLYADLVHHYHQSEQRSPERKYAELAGGYAAEKFANEDALGYLSRALALTEGSDVEGQYRLLLAHEAVANTSGRRDDQAKDIGRLTTLAATANVPGWQAEALLRQAHYHRVTNEYEPALAITRQVLLLAESAADIKLSMAAHNCWGKIAWRQNQYSAAAAHFQIALQEAENSDQRAKIADNLYHLGLVDTYQADYGRAISRFKTASAHYAAVQDIKGEIQCIYMFGVIHRYMGEYLKAQSHFDAGLARCQTIGWKPTEAHFVGELGNNYFQLGDYARSAEYHRQSLTVCRDLDDREGEAISLDTLGLVAYMRGDALCAMSHYHQALEIQQAINDRRGIGYTQTHLGYANLDRGNFIAAETLFRSAARLREEIGESNAAIESRAGLARAQMGRGRANAAVTAAEEIALHLHGKGADGIEFPLQVCLVCFQIFLHAAPIDPDYHQQARKILDWGYEYLQRRADEIGDPELRVEFLEQAPFNRDLIAAWQAD